MEGIAGKVIAILARQALLGPEDVGLEDTPESLGLDSLGLVEAIFAIEEAFDISVPFNPNAPDEAPEFDISTVRQIIAGVERLVAARGA